MERFAANRHNGRLANHVIVASTETTLGIASASVGVATELKRRYIELIAKLVLSNRWQTGTCYARSSCTCFIAINVSLKLVLYYNVACRA